MNEATRRSRAHHAVLVSVQATRGSVPRESGTWMAVFADSVTGTIGGGHLEFEAIAHARSLLASQGADEVRHYSLGPTLGQCCGGAVDLAFRQVSADELEQERALLAASHSPVALFGGGHVGKALVRVLGTLPFRVRWIDSRDEIFPEQVPAHVECEHSDPVQAAVADLAPRSRVLIMSFSHAEDLDVVAACLKRRRERADLPYIGLIGSKTKWAVFRHRLEARGFTGHDFEGVTSPIGVPGIEGKEPEVIAVAVAAQLLQLRDKPLA